MTSALVVLGGYLLGSMPFGYWLVRLGKGEDIRRVGSDVANRGGWGNGLAARLFCGEGVFKLRRLPSMRRRSCDRFRRGEHGAVCRDWLVAANPDQRDGRHAEKAGERS